MGAGLQKPWGGEPGTGPLLEPDKCRFLGKDTERDQTYKENGPVSKNG